MNFEKFLRTSFLQNTSGRLFLLHEICKYFTCFICLLVISYFSWNRVKWHYLEPGVVACLCNPASLEAEFRNGVGLC